MATKSSATTAEKDATSTGTPNQTLYIKNLPEKLNKNEVKRALYMLFSTYGPVLDVVTVRKNMRGQAHVVYKDIQTSTQAMRALQGFDFFGQEMIIAYGKGQSSIIPKLRGTFIEPTAAMDSMSEATALQRSIFNAPPPSTTAKPTEINGLPSKPQDPEPHGVKRQRENDEASEASEVSMEEDDEDDAPMEEDED